MTPEEQRAMDERIRRLEDRGQGELLSLYQPRYGNCPPTPAEAQARLLVIEGEMKKLAAIRGRLVSERERLRGALEKI